MASESTRHIKGLSDTIWADFTIWPGFDEASLEPDTLAKFLNRKEAIKAYLSGTKVAAIREEYGISEPHIYRLITERCIRDHPDGQIYGWRALIPQTRIVQFKRRTPIVIRAGLGNSDRWIKDDSSAFWANNVGRRRRNHESQTTQKPLARL